MPPFTLAASTVVTPEGLLEPGEVRVDDGVITAVGPLPSTARTPARVLTPGFVDLQVNGHGDVDCATATGGDWDRLDAHLVASGVTAWCPTLITAPLAAYAAPLAEITAAAARPASPARPAVLGAHLEGPFLGGAPGAHPAEHVVAVDLDWLAALPPVVRLVTLAPEAPGAVAAIETLVRRGVVVSIGHTTASAGQATAAVEAGARLVTHLFNGMAPLHHREPGVVGVALADDRLAVSLVADGVHVHPLALRVAARAKGRGRWVLVSDAVAWGTGDLRGRPVALEGGAPRLADGTLAGSALTMDAAVRRMVGEAGISLADAVAAASTTPADLLGLPDRGRIAVGCRADLVALAPGSLAVEEVWIAP